MLNFEETNVTTSWCRLRISIRSARRRYKTNATGFCMLTNWCSRYDWFYATKENPLILVRCARTPCTYWYSSMSTSSIFILIPQAMLYCGICIWTEPLSLFVCVCVCSPVAVRAGLLRAVSWGNIRVKSRRIQGAQGNAVTLSRPACRIFQVRLRCLLLLPYLAKDSYCILCLCVCRFADFRVCH